jgi:hypothetical protein
MPHGKSLSPGALDSLRRAAVDFNKDFAWAPADWIVLGLLVIAAAGNWQKGQDLTHTCDLLLERQFLVSFSDAQKDEIAAICIKPTAGE